MLYSFIQIGLYSVISIICSGYYESIFTECFQIQTTICNNGFNVGHAECANMIPSHKSGGYCNGRIHHFSKYSPTSIQMKSRNCESSVTIPSRNKSIDIQSHSEPTNDEDFYNVNSHQMSSTRLNVTETETELESALSELQMYALCSKIAKYIVSTDLTLRGRANGSPSPTKKAVVLWRSLLDDTPELIGYPINFLSEQIKSMIDLRVQSSKSQSIGEFLSTTISGPEVDWDVILPYLDVYAFETGGGVSGLAYGVVGVADGTRLRTTPVRNLSDTIPRNYVETDDGSLYELGRPVFSTEIDSTLLQTATTRTQEQSYSLSGIATKKWFRDGKETASLMVKNTATSLINEENSIASSSAIDPDLLNLVGLTTLALVGATAMQSLSHHLTVNVFWV